MHTEHGEQGDHKGCHGAHNAGRNAEGIIGAGLTVRVGAAAQCHAGGGGTQTLPEDNQDSLKPVFAYPALAKEEADEDGQSHQHHRADRWRPFSDSA